MDCAADALAARLGDQAESTHLVGLSAGAMIALRCAAQHSVGSLFLSAPEVKAPRALIKLQNFVFRLLPQRAFASSGLSKEDMITHSRALAKVNLSGDARAITAPTTIACGSRDRANLPAARKAHGLIAQSKLLVIDAVGHEWHRQAPDLFAEKLLAHIRQS